MNITLRDLDVSDAPMLAGMHAESFGGESWSIDQLKGSLILATTRGLLAVVDAQPAGFILCQVTEAQAEVLTFCVRPEARQQGVGEYLLCGAMNELASKGSMLLEVAADNQVARRLYSRCGFRQSGVRKDYYRRGTQLIDAITYSYGVNP